MNGFVFYDGPSRLNGERVLGIATKVQNQKKDANEKTGAMVQIYILVKDQSPVEARHSGQDEAICGDCLHKQGTCYVRIEQGPTQVWKAFHRGAYPEISIQDGRAALAGKYCRLGTYGDPAAIPFAVWALLLKDAAGWTGYTHQWKRPSASQYRRYCMASCDTEAEYKEAKRQGWRAFYVLPKNTATKPQGAMLCPASEEAGKKLHCVDCRACEGTGGPHKAHVYIPVHGVTFKQERFAQLIQIGAR